MHRKQACAACASLAACMVEGAHSTWLFICLLHRHSAVPLPRLSRGEDGKWDEAAKPVTRTKPRLQCPGSTKNFGFAGSVDFDSTTEGVSANATS